ncbi:MAG: helicase, partial [Bacillota bacterium]
MSIQGERPDVKGVLAQLKGFQRRTAQYAFRRLFVDEDSTRRFLVADEVGLGKTKVAQGVVALAIDHLWDKVKRIDIIYICSNADIARQNMGRLNVRLPGHEGFMAATRITLLPKVVKELDKQPVNLIALTPGTSFDLTSKSSLGTAEERVLLYWMLDTAWGVQGSTGPLNVLQGWVGDKDDFRSRVATFDQSSIDEALRKQFAHDLALHVAKERAAGLPDLRSRFDELCDRFRYFRKRPAPEDAADRARLVGELRAVLAASCLRALQPDLIILDEFQRFKHLLGESDQSDSALLARELFNYSDETSAARVLLLSATPYKMYTLQAESAEDDHYQDFLETLRFLDGDGADLAGVQALLREYRRELYRLADESEPALARLTDLKGRLEQHLRRVMVRTERLAASEDRSGMLVQKEPVSARLAARDLQGYLAARKVSEVVGEPDPLTYWKAAPYLLNMMDNYKLKQRLEEHLDLPGQRGAVAQALTTYPAGLLPFDEFRRYQVIDPANARLRALQADTIDAGMWRLLWMVPSLPYYQPAGPYSAPGAATMTKRLIFSAWQVVPKAVSTLLSYEAERRVIASFEGEAAENTPEARRRRRPLLRFARTDDRLTGMPVLGLLYPSVALAALGDPLMMGAETLPVLLDEVRRRLAEPVASVVADAPQEGPVDEAWYWAAPILLDLAANPDATREWFDDAALAGRWGAEEHRTEDDGEESHWAAHVDLARSLAQGTGQPLGRPPEDLLDVLALLAVAGPGVAALRALGRIVPEPGDADLLMRDAAGRMAWALRRLFNLPEVTAMLRGLNPAEPYWRRVLEYCADGCLQAVLDEYMHVLLDAEGLRGRAGHEVMEGLSEAMVEAVTLRTVTLFADEIRVNGGDVKLEREGMRARFALRYGVEQG